MKQNKQISSWLRRNTTSLAGKTVAVTGSTGGLGRALCHTLASLGASLILVDRNAERAEAHRAALTADFPAVSVRCLQADMEDITSVRSAADLLLKEPLDVLILNAGAYSIPRHKCSTGYDNVFEINFVSPYYLVRRLLPVLSARKGRVVAVGSIAHNYGKTVPSDIDFSTRKRASQVYGNAKRFLMFSLLSLFENEHAATLAVTHPGISLTGITAHYPKVVFALIKHPMKLIFMRPEKACLSIVRGVFEPSRGISWIGPRVLDVWGLPKQKPLRTASREEIAFIQETAERIYNTISDKSTD